MSESLDVATVVPSDVLPIVARFMPLLPQKSTQESHLSSEQLSPNRVRSDFDVDTVDLYPMLLRRDQLPALQAARSMQDEAYESVSMIPSRHESGHVDVNH